jgi:hypothetical protein
MLLLIAICKNELDLDCWIDYHLTIGFDKIFIWDDFSEIPIQYNDSRVEIRLIEEKDKKSFQSKQVIYYTKAINEFKDYFKWIAVFDGDEYLVFDKDRTLQDVLNDYSEYGSVCPNFLAFGNGNHDRKPDGRVFENFTKRSEQNWNGNLMIKSILQSKYFTYMFSMHASRSTKQSVTEMNEIIERDISTISTSNKIWLNHYYVKSREHWETKMKRGAITGHPNDIKTWEHFKIWDRNEIEDTRAIELYYKMKNDRNAK